MRVGSANADQTSVVHSGIKVASSSSSCLPYGKSYWSLNGCAKSLDNSKGSKKSSTNKDDGADVFIPTDITLKNYKEFTFYQMLGVTESTCDEATLKKSYHKAVLLYHPDKKHGDEEFKNEKGQEDRTVFLKMQEATTHLVM